MSEACASTWEALLFHRRARLVSFVLPVLVVLLSGSQFTASRAEPSRVELEDRVEATLSRHLDGPRITAWLARLPADSLERDAADWILAWLPLSDLAALDLPLLREHVEVAAETYRQSPWRDQLPHDLWLRFVVPHRVSQEPAQAWRRLFHEALAPRIAGASTMEEAALAVNRWCREQATFKPTSGRDQGPLTTVARGIGRCEEEMILAISALRAAGIPARSCATPYWSFTDNNHAWVETWADGRWWYLGGCEPDRCLNRAWFTGAASRTGFVRSVGYGEFDPDPEPLYRSELGSTVINSTSVYTDPIEVTAMLGGAWSDSVNAEIRVNVLNFGSLRPIAQIRSGGMIELGPGEYAFTAGDGRTLLLEVAGGRSGDKIEVILDDSDRYDLDAAPGFWLRYPESDARPVRDLDLVSELEQDRLERNISHRDGDRAKLRNPSESEMEQLEALSDEERTRFESALEKPYERASTLFALLGDYTEGEGRTALIEFLDAADDKDLLELRRTDIRSHIDQAMEVRERHGLTMPDSVFAEGLLACRIEREPGGPWRDALPLVPIRETAEETLQAILDLWADRMETEESGFFGAPLDPAQAWKLGRGTERDVKTGLVGLLRRNGFPSRYQHGRVDVWLGSWKTVDAETGRILDPGDPSAGEGGRIDIVITRDGEPYVHAESYRHFNVSRPESGWLESPWWDPKLGEQDWDTGSFVLSSANRVPGGSVYGRLRAFDVRPGETTRVAIPLEVDPGWEPGETFIAGVAPEKFNAFLEKAGLRRTGRIADDAGRLTFVFEPGEPALRMIEALGRVAPRLETRGIGADFVLISESRPTKELSDALEAAGFPEPVRVPRDDAEPLMTAEGLSPVVSLDLGGELRYLREGFDTAVDNSLHLVLDLARP